jgi:hypothetical protein
MDGKILFFVGLNLIACTGKPFESSRGVAGELAGDAGGETFDGFARRSPAPDAEHQVEQLGPDTIDHRVGVEREDGPPKLEPRPDATVDAGRESEASADILAIDSDSIVDRSEASWDDAGELDAAVTDAGVTDSSSTCDVEYCERYKAVYPGACLGCSCYPSC